MDAQEYINLTDQIARQTPEQQGYVAEAANLNAQADAMQPDIDDAQAAVDVAQLTVNEAQAALAAAIEAGEDPVPFEEALAAAQSDLFDAQQALNALTAQQDELHAQANIAAQNALVLEQAMADCQALIDANQPPPTPAEIAAERAREAAVMSMETKTAGASQMAVVNATFTGQLTKARIIAALGGASPLRSTSFLVRNSTSLWIVIYDQSLDTYWSNEMKKET